MVLLAVVVALSSAGGCGGGPITLADGAADASVKDAIAFDPCGSICLRPADCAIAYPDGDLCPAGFLCSTHFSCGSDGGSGD